MAADAYAVGETLEHGLHAVSDGSEWFYTQGSFGWILSLDEGERLVTGMGSPCSSQSNSYRSEGHGILALLSFLKRLAKYIQLHDPWQGIIATGSKSLIDTIHRPRLMQLGPVQVTVFRRPLDPLSLEWDIVVGVQTLLNKFRDYSCKNTSKVTKTEAVISTDYRFCLLS